MTKWARMRKRKERIRAESSTNYASEENEAKLTEPEKISDNINPTLDNSCLIYYGVRFKELPLKP